VNIAMRLTLDGLIRALRVEAHRLAENAEAGALTADEMPALRGGDLRREVTWEDVDERRRD
jgi:hypothetical protein